MRVVAWDFDKKVGHVPKVFLRNVLSKSKTQIRELRVESDRKKREVEGSKNSCD
jgi:hypothetical protein